MRNYVRCALMASSVLMATAVAAADPAKSGKRESYSPYVDAKGNISFRQNFPTAISISALGRYLAKKEWPTPTMFMHAPRMSLIFAGTVRSRMAP